MQVAALLKSQQFPIGSALARQFAGRAVLNHASALQHHDAVEAPHGGKAVRNRHHGAAIRGREAEVRLHVPNAFHEESHRRSARQISR